MCSERSSQHAAAPRHRGISLHATFTAHPKNKGVALQLNQVTLPTTDLPRAVDFYIRLGLKQIVASEHYARFELPDGDATFSLHVVDAVAPSQTVIYFECEQLDQRVRQLSAAGVAFDTQPQDQSWLWREARLRDPDGNRLCFYHAGENRKYPPWRIDDD